MSRLVVALILRALGLRLPGDIELDALDRYQDDILAGREGA